MSPRSLLEARIYITDLALWCFTVWLDEKSDLNSLIVNAQIYFSKVLFTALQWVQIKTIRPCKCHSSIIKISTTNNLNTLTWVTFNVRIFLTTCFLFFSLWLSVSTFYSQLFCVSARDYK